VRSLLFDHALLPEGWRDHVLVRLAGGTIQSVTADVVGEAHASPVRGWAVPGVANLHSHAFQRGFAGLAERRGSGDDHFWTWREQMYRFALAISPDDLQALAAFAYMEMLESGFTEVAEFHYVHHQTDGRPFDDPAEMSLRLLAASEQAGIAITLLPVFYAHGGFGGAPTNPAQRRFVCDLDLFERLFDRLRAQIGSGLGARLGIAPHSLRAVTASQLQSLVERHVDCPLHIHIAEQRQEVDDCIAATGARPVEWLLAHADVDARWCLVHATHMVESETAALARSQATAGLCPLTEANLGDGIFDAVLFMRQSGTFGVGSDSNISISLPQELRMLEYSQRLRDQARNRLASPLRSTGRVLFDQAARGGARALGSPAGQIAAGARADFVVLDGDDPSLLCKVDDGILDAWIFSGQGTMVREVYVAGAKLVAGGRHIRRSTLESQWRKVLPSLLGQG
jgi:formimidoylglutamate deiminase